MFNSQVFIEDRIVANFSFLSVVNVVLVSVSDFLFVSILCNLVSPFKHLNLSSESMLFFLNVKHLILGFKGGDRHISPLGDIVIAISNPWLPCVSCIHIWFISDLITYGVPLFFS